MENAGNLELIQQFRDETIYGMVLAIHMKDTFVQVDVNDKN